MCARACVGSRVRLQQALVLASGREPSVGSLFQEEEEEDDEEEVEGEEGEKEEEESSL